MGRRRPRGPPLAVTEQTVRESVSQVTSPTHTNERLKGHPENQEGYKEVSVMSEL